MDPDGAFVDLARQYSRLIEDQGPANSRQFAFDCLRLVLRLYEAATWLPGAASADYLSWSRQDWDDTFKNVGRKLTHDNYWHVFEPLEPEPDLVVGSLADDLTDIWQEIKTGIVEMESGNPDSGIRALRHWRVSFEFHWASHAAWAIGALHALCYSWPLSPAGQSRRALE